MITVIGNTKVSFFVEAPVEGDAFQISSFLLKIGLAIQAEASRCPLCNIALFPAEGKATVTLVYGAETAVSLAASEGFQQLLASILEALVCDDLIAGISKLSVVKEVTRIESSEPAVLYKPDPEPT